MRRRNPLPVRAALRRRPSLTQAGTGVETAGPGAGGARDGRTPRRLALLRRLSDGGVHSSPALARRLGVGVEALREDLDALREHGLEIVALPEGRVRLPSSFEMLDAGLLLAELDPARRRVLEAVDVLFEVGSTNQHLLDLARHAAPAGPRGCLAEVQNAGRGRAGRPFFSSLGGSILLSLLWPVRVPPAELLGLSPAIAVALARAFESEGVERVGLKWPNDVCVGGRKVSGILLEIGRDRQGRGVLVIGAGINVRVPAPTGRRIDQAWTDLHRALGRTPGRNRVAGRVIDRIIATMQVYLDEGFAPFRREYRRRDLLAGRRVVVQGAGGDLVGSARGLDEAGALLVESGGCTSALLSGEVKVRPAP